MHRTPVAVHGPCVATNWISDPKIQISCISVLQLCPKCFAFPRFLSPLQTKDCPWAMSKAEMLSRQRDDSIQGNTILMTRQAPGKLLSLWRNRRFSSFTASWQRFYSTIGTFYKVSPTVFLMPPLISLHSLDALPYLSAMKA